MLIIQDLVKAIDLNQIDNEADFYLKIAEVVKDKQLDFIQTKLFATEIGKKWNKLRLN